MVKETDDENQEIISRPTNRESKTFLLTKRRGLNVLSNSHNIMHYHSEVKDTSYANLG